MILKNPENGAPIKTTIDQKIWKFEVGQTLDFTNFPSVGEQMKERYGFLEEVEGSQPAELVEEGDTFKCSACEYTNKLKVAVIAHMKGHTKIVAEEAVSVGDVAPRPTIMEARLASMGQKGDFDDMPNGIGADGIEVYGEGFQEEKPGANYNMNGIPGRFGAAR